MRLHALELEDTPVSKVVTPLGHHSTKPVLQRVVDPELAIDWLKQEKVLADLVLLEAHCLVKEAFLSLVHSYHGGTHVRAWRALLRHDCVVQIDQLEVFGDV